MILLRRFVAAFVVSSCLAGAAMAADAVQSQPVQFTRGTSSATIKGAIKGYQIIDYTLRARAGQEMSVKFKTSNDASYFNVLSPGSEVALFVGSTSGNEWFGALPDDGVYRVRVYLMRSAARRNETARYTLTVGIRTHVDAKVKGTPYHATGTVPCGVGTDPLGTSQCAFGVIRSGPGKAEVRLASPGYDIRNAPKDDVRVLHFSGTSVTSPSARVHAEKYGDEWTVDVDDFHHYRIPEAVVDGG